MGPENERRLNARAGALLSIVLIITLGFMTILPDIKINMDFKKFLPENEEIKSIDEMEKYFGKEDVHYYILVESNNRIENVITPNALREQYNVSNKALQHDGVIDVYSLALLVNNLTERITQKSLLETDDSTLNSYIELFRTQILIQANLANFSSEYEALTGIFLSNDFDPEKEPLTVGSTVIIVLLDPNLNMQELKELSADLKKELDDVELENISISHTGNHLLTSDIDEIGNQNVILLGFAMVLLVVFVLAFTFRKISYVLLPLATLFIAIIWTFGTMTILGLSFTIIDITVIPLLLGLGVDYTVHTSRRYLSELEKTDSHVNAMNRAQRRIVPAIFLAVLTTTIAFMSNQLSSIKPVREFGLICAIGIFYAFILTLIFHNTSRVLVDRVTAARFGKENRKVHEDTKVVDVAVRTAARSVSWFPVLAITMVGVITSLAIVGAINVRTEFSETDFLPEDLASIETSKKINDRFEAGRYSEIFIFIRDEHTVPQNIATLEMLRQFDQLEDELKDDKYVVKFGENPRMESPLVYIKRILLTNSTMAGIYDQNGDGFPDESTQVPALFDFLMDHNEIADPITGQTYSQRMNRILHRNGDDYYDAAKISIFVRAETTFEMQDMYEELKNELPGFLDTKVVITGNIIMTIITIDALQSSQINSTILAIIVAVIILSFLYRSIGLGLISMVPVVLSTLWILGTMYFFDISRNVLTVMVTALTIGLGLDYAIYIVSRYQEERKNQNIEDAIEATIRGTGSALFISGVTTISGFAVLVLSKIPIVKHFGLIIATTIIYCGVLAVVVLPILLGTWEKVRMKKSGKKKLSDRKPHRTLENEDDY